MSKTFDQGREEIAKLCRYFADNRQAFLAAGVKEAHIRQSLIDPFFEALGWDLRNAAMTAPQYREVITEDSLEIEGQQKAPDYAFRVGTLSKFYTEAKKCGININADPGPAYQLRRYGWSAKVPLSILTDFEELGVYDCSLRPKPTDKASFARIQYFKSEQYPDCWRELWDIFSREAVWAGAYDRYAASKRKRGTSEVDSEFLKEIEGWRDSLARNIALRNLYLGYDDLNTAVQRTIDRIIFLRMAEDRGSESYGQLLKLCDQPDIYSRFMSKSCRNADEKYNSGLFHFRKEEGTAESLDALTPKLQVDDKVFKPILESLYFEHGSPYHFGVLPVEILGTVYERFLGKVIRLTPEHRAKIEEKPEVRKAGGVYYTPSYIVDYIVKNTVGKMIEGKSPAQLAGGKNGQPLRVLDMACGSGSFLLGAFQCLLDHCLKWYMEHQPEKFKNETYKNPKGEWRLAIAEKKRILTSHIFGVDIDAQAVEVSKLSLLLKVMEGETDESVGKSRQLFHERALPNLSNNIKCGNSLIGPDYFSGRLIPDPDEMKRVNPFDWDREFPEAMKAGGFDCVIGNPPYIGFHGFKEDKEYFKNKFRSAEGKFDLYLPFIEKGIELIRQNGLLSFICPTNFSKRGHGKSLRKLIQRSVTIRQICDFEDQQIFKGATNYTGIFVFEKSTPKNDHKILYKNAGLNDDGFYISQFDLGDEAWVFRNDEINLVINKIEKQKIKRLGEISHAISEGIVTGNNDVFLLKQDEINKFGIEGNVLRECIRGSEIRRYRLEDIKEFVIYPYVLKNNKTVTLSEGELEKNKNAYNYLKSNKITLSGRGYFEKSTKHWFELWCQRSIEILSSNKIVVAELSDRNRFMIAESDQFYGDTVCGITFPDNDSENLKYYLGLLNSKLMEFYFKKTTVPKAGGFYIYKTMFLNKLPIYIVESFKKPTHDHIVALVEQMLDLQKHITISKTESEKLMYQRQVEATDHEIDQLVYELYGLTEKEIKIIEGS
jgi:type I restriction-modification system DNA methylase subunit